MIPKGKGLPKYADDATLNQIRGKAMLGHQTLEDVWTLLDHLSPRVSDLEKQIEESTRIRRQLEQELREGMDLVEDYILHSDDALIAKARNARRAVAKAWRQQVAVLTGSHQPTTEDA